ncbi:lysophospholipid acyltransferase family protein [Litoreibacter roseus]|uniref:Glycerol acyltransferase n=1 Tax=Litoreibacter roseus TaxID=2601869 RepID=A0A6N6JJ21_9RHOB|nr:lysophospholipid acyltransferase family protein [Litoreibacter roseus]GFE66124.1 glycerol acyltransferase [Litoreibacter roseus]
MRDRIDPLIAERAPWLFGSSLRAKLARPLIERVLSYDRTLEIAEVCKHLPTDQIMGAMGDMLACNVAAQGLDRIPRSGPAMVICNHPTGIADGIILHHLLAPLRPDLFIYANSDILKVLPQMESLILPVEWRHDKRSHAKTRETMEQTEAALKAGRLGVIFPAGRLAKRRGLRLFERDWMASAAMIARKFDVPLIPMHIQARNSALFYMLDLIHPTLRDITLFHETLNKDRQPFQITVGEAISPKALPLKSADAIHVLRRATLALNDAKDPSVSLVKTSALVKKLAS